MPELPEVETIVRGTFAPPFREGPIEQLRVLHRDVLRQPPEALLRPPEGPKVRVHPPAGEEYRCTIHRGQTVLVVNLGMTGRLLLAKR